MKFLLAFALGFIVSRMLQWLLAESRKIDEDREFRTKHGW